MAKDYDVWCRTCGCLMKRRNGKFGWFWGCTGYPRCKTTLKLERGDFWAATGEDPDTCADYVGGPHGETDGYGEEPH